MQRAVAIALAGGLLAASAGAFGLAQVLKLERSPIEAIHVDPTPNHGRGQLDRHDSALFSPRCRAPCSAVAQVRFKVHASGPVRAEVVSANGAVVRDLGALPHPGGKVIARWNGRDATGAIAPAGSYRLKVAVSGRHVELLNPLVLDGSVGVLGTNVSPRVISPDCDTHGDRVTVVVRAREQLAGLQLQVRKGSRLIRTVRLRKRARALAISWPPYAGTRCRTAPDGNFALRVVARDVAGNTRAIGLGSIVSRGVALHVPDRAIVAGRRVRVGISADARSLRLDLARVGARPSVLARGAHAPSATARIPADARGGLYAIGNRHAGRTVMALLAVRAAVPARVALLVGLRPTAGDAVYQRRLDALGIRFDAFTRRDAAAGLLRGHAVVVAPPDAGEVAAGGGARLVRRLAGIVRGLGS
jgi:hypothetical protein